MVSMISYLYSFLAIMFWAFRLVVAYCYSMEIDIGFEPLNMGIELVLLVISVPGIVAIVKRNLLGTFIYAMGYWLYFGSDLIVTVASMISGSYSIALTTEAVSAVVGVGIPVLNLLDVYINKNRVGKSGDRKTDWFYKNKDYERQYDERADRNNYRTR